MSPRRSRDRPSVKFQSRRERLAQLRQQMKALKDEVDADVAHQEFVSGQGKKIKYNEISEEARLLEAEINQVCFAK